MLLVPIRGTQRACRYAATEEECRTMIAIMSKDATRKPAAGLTFEVLCEFTDNYEIISNPA
eukprot:765790-Hanusia_phi.AAC.5